MTAWNRPIASNHIIPRIPSLLHLNHLLQLCSISKSLHQGQQIHQHLTVSGSHHDPFTVTKLIQMYADCDDLSSAHKLFDKLPYPNVFSWTAILGFYLRRGMYEECVRNYGFMKFRGVLPDNYVFPKVLRACTQLQWLEGGVWVHKDVIVCGFGSNLLVCNSLIDMYGKCEDVENARRVFDEMVERDLLSWNSMISAYVYNGLLDCAVKLCEYLRSDGFGPDVVTWNTLVDGYCQKGLCDEAVNVFRQIDEPNIISWTTLISGYSRIGKHETSLRIFKDMVNGWKVFPDLHSLSSVLASSRHLGAVMIGKEIHAYGIRMDSGTAFYTSAGAALLTLYAKCGKMQYAINVFDLMDKTDTVTWNSMILGFIELELGHLALQCFCEMQRLGTKNDQTTISTVLPICDLKSGKQIHTYVRKSNLHTVIPVWNAVIHMYCKSGCIKSAYSVFSSMVDKDLVTWNTMIGGFGMHGLGHDALQLLKRMNLSGVSPNSTTFTSVLSACNHSGLVDEGLKLFNTMTKDYGFSPRMEHYSCIVDMLARSDHLEDAVRFINKMPIEPDKTVWGALLAACRDHQNIDIGKLAAEKLIRLEPERAGHYVTLSNMYAREGKWYDAERVRKEMDGRGLVKPSGQSWIEIGQ